jgi:hypothetical protein
MAEGDSYMDLGVFVTESPMHTGKLQYWINGDEDSVVLEFNAAHSSNVRCSVRVISNKVYDYPKGGEDMKDAQVWGVPFCELASFVDAVRAIMSNRIEGGN